MSRRQPISYLVSVVISVLCACGADPVTSGITGLGGGITSAILGNALTDFADRISVGLDEGISGGDYLLENSSRKADLLLRNAQIILESELDKRVDQLSVQGQTLVGQLNLATQRLKETEEGILALEDFLALDIQSYVDQLPFNPDDFMLRSIEGYSQVYQRSGSYSFAVIGSAFGTGYVSNIRVGDYEVPISNIRTPRIYTLEFDVPVSELNDMFDDQVPSRVPFTLVSRPRDDDEVVFEYADEMVLLPRLPLQYTLIEHSAEPVWSKPKWTTESSKRIPRTGKQFRWSNYEKVSVSVPANAIMLKGTEKKRIEPGSHKEWKKEPLYEGEKTVSWEARHRIHDRHSTLYLKVKYIEPVSGEFTNADLSLVLSDISDNTRYEDAVPFGTFTTELAPDYQTYTLHAIYFNGASVAITPTNPSESGISVSVEGGQRRKRLVVSVAAP